MTLSSELELPELSPVHNTDADVDIVFGEVPEHLPEIRGSGVLYEAAYNDFLFKFEGLGRYRVQNGNRIIIQSEKNALPEEIRLFLLGSNIGALLHQRGILTIHGSAVTNGKQTTILSGKSGAGAGRSRHHRCRQLYKGLGHSSDPELSNRRVRTG